MYSWNLEKDRQEADIYLTEKRSDFVTTYMMVSSLQFIIDQEPEIIKESTITALLCVLENEDHARQRQVYFLHKKAADALGAILKTTPDPGLAGQAKNSLIQILHQKNEKPFRAAAEALGTLPLKIKGPVLKAEPDWENSRPSISGISWQTLIQKSGFNNDSSALPFEWKGRNLIVYSNDPDRVLVIKMARPKEDPAMLAKEGLWMDFLAKNRLESTGPDDRFRIPEPLCFAGGFVFRLKDLPAEIPVNAAIDSQYTGIAFITSSEYFCYPNEHSPDRLLPVEIFYEIITRSAMLLGELAAAGIIHTAPIPLFHNRVQRHRRDDGGLYQWPKGGRLDRWLSSCQFPNIGKTGIRDFEHFLSFNGSSRKLYEYIGSHIFSLVLICGSYFRNIDEQITGLDACGHPVDARHLFDQQFLEKTVTGIFTNYYKGFTGSDFFEPFPVDIDHLTERLIDEMGVDRHMEEILRVAEQNIMNDLDFFEFLSSRGYTAKQISTLEKGKADITILTGPHLGGFNQPISTPELIEFTAAAAALCISDRYCQEKISAL